MPKAKNYIKIEMAENGCTVLHNDCGYGSDLKKTVHHPVTDALYDVLTRLVGEEDAKSHCTGLARFFMDKALEIESVKDEPKKEEAASSDDIPFN